MGKLGAHVLAIGEDDGALDQIPGANVLALRSGLPSEARLPLYLPPLQLIAHQRGTNKGLDPDHPRNLHFSIEIPGLGGARH